MKRKVISLLVTVRNCQDAVSRVVTELSAQMEALCGETLDYEIIMIDNGSSDDTADKLAIAVRTVPQFKVMCLVSDGDPDAAALAGLEATLGDITVLMDAATDAPSDLPALVNAVLNGADIAISAPYPGAARGDLAYRVLSAIFVRVFRVVSGVHLRDGAGLFRAMTRDVVGYVTKHETARQAHRALPLLGGFRTVTVKGAGVPLIGTGRVIGVRRGIDRALGLLTSTSTAPLRAATAACAAAAALSLVYSVYVAFTYFFRSEVAPGWTTLSLQMSVMFFLLAVAVALLSEYVLHMASSSFRRPPYHVAREFCSADLTREQRLNVVAQPVSAAVP